MNERARKFALLKKYCFPKRGMLVDYCEIQVAKQTLDKLLTEVFVLSILFRYPFPPISTIPAWICQMGVLLLLVMELWMYVRYPTQ